MTVTERKRRNNPHQPVGRWIRPAKRAAIYARDDHRCLACGDDLRERRAYDVTLDHVVPVSRGGKNDPSNLYTCCRGCNVRRGVRPLSDAFGSDRAAQIEARAAMPLRQEAA